MPNTTSKAQFARDCNVSKPAISKAVKNGSVILTADEKVDLDHRVTKEYISVQAAKKKDAPKASPPEKPKKAPAKKVTPEKKPSTQETEASSAEEPEGEEGQQEFAFTCLDDITPENIHSVTKNKIEIFSKYETALKIKQERQEKRGSLVRRSFIKTIFSKLYAIYTNQFKTMETRLVPDICEIFKLPDSSDEAIKLRLLINRDNAKTLKNIKRIFDDAVLKMDEP